MSAATTASTGEGRPADLLEVRGAKYLPTSSNSPVQRREVLLFAPNAKGYVGFTDDQEDHLNVFSPRLLHKYLGEGLPDIPRCRQVTESGMGLGSPVIVAVRVEPLSENDVVGRGKGQEDDLSLVAEQFLRL